MCLDNFFTLSRLSLPREVEKIEIMGNVGYLSVMVNPAQMEGIWARSAVLFGRQIENEHHDFSGLSKTIYSK